MIKSYCLKERKVTEGYDPKILRTKTIELWKELYVEVVVFINKNL